MRAKMKQVTKKVMAIAIMMSLILTGMLMLRNENCMAATKTVSSFEVFPSYTKNADGTITVTVRAKGDISKFDFGVVYDNTKLKFVKRAFAPNFLEKYDGIYASGDVGTHVVFGGVTDSDYFYYNGNVATVTFSVIGKDPGSVMVVLDSASYHGNFSNAASAPGTKILKLS